MIYVFLTSCVRAQAEKSFQPIARCHRYYIYIYIYICISHISPSKEGKSRTISPNVFIPYKPAAWITRLDRGADAACSDTNVCLLTATISVWPMFCVQSMGTTQRTAYYARYSHCASRRVKLSPAQNPWPRSTRLR